MVRPGARRGDDDLGPLTDRTGRVEGRVVTASIRGVRGHHSTLYMLSTPAPFGPVFHPATPIPFRTQPSTPSHRLYTPISYDPCRSSQPPCTSYDPYAHAPSLPLHMPGQDRPLYHSKTQVSLNEEFRWTHPTTMLTVEPLIVAIPNLMLDWTGAADGGPQDAVLILSYSGYIVDSIWRVQRSVLNSLSRFMSLTGLDILVFSYVCPSGENESEVVQAIYPEVSDVGTQNEI
ncbi:hypothetical protein M9H77_25349 [Catharanthus roseus]|uniref:Uncharacterized protein n=1 Tax=Catharanthus roseus TaxID=4058 RepID=A0ACC0A7J4_CATRO|nr:hypothetical protein M9H77_25349 [Catharanthus roseus]